jgi:hypothetical protein
LTNRKKKRDESVTCKNSKWYSIMAFPEQPVPGKRDV